MSAVDRDIQYDRAANVEAQPMATVYLRGRIWWGKYRKFLGIDGGKDRWSKPICVSTRERDQAAAIEYMHMLERKEADKRLAVRLGTLSEQDLTVIEHGDKGLDEVIDAYLKTLRSEGWRSKARGTLHAMAKHTGYTSARQLGHLSAVVKLEAFLRDDAARGLTSETLSVKLSIIKKFTRWLWLKGYAREDQGQRLERIAGDDNRKIEHRAFTPKEFDLLVADMPELFAEISKIDAIPLARRVFYETRTWTGLRGEEAMRLIRSDFNLGDRPTMTIRKEVALKNSVACTLPITRRLAERLAQHCGMLHPTARIFGSLPARRETRAQQLQRDLRTAGVDPELINERSFRMTHETWLRQAGLDDSEIGTLRRDRGEGTKLLRRWHYTDMRQLIEPLRAKLEQADQWYRRSVSTPAQEAAG